MKKLLSIITASSILAAAVPMAFAADADYEKLIPDVKNRLGIPEEYSEFTYQGISSDENGEMYSFRWSKKDEADRIFVDVRGNGDIFSYRISDYAPEYDYLSADDSTEAKAREFMTILVPSLKGDIRLEPVLYQYGAIDYNVYLERNGVEYADPIGTISVKSDGTLESARIWPVDLPDEDVSSFISAEDAYAKYMAADLIKTQYNSYEDEDGKLITFPIYSIPDVKAISAATGEVIGLEDYYEMFARSNMKATAEDAEAEAGGMAYKELSESEKQEIARVNGFVSEEKVTGLIKDKLGITLNDDVRYSLNVNKKGGNYHFYYIDPDKYDTRMVITIDAKTGDFTYVYTTSAFESKLSEYDFSDPESMKKLIRELAPKSAGDYEPADEEPQILKQETREGAGFKYKVNGIEVSAASAFAAKQEDSYLICITPLEEYKAAEYASPDTFIGVQNAFKVSDMQLKYTGTENGIEAVYMPSDYTDINAQTGKRVNYRNEEPQQRRSYTYSDIDGHWIKPAAEKLALAGIGFKGGEFKPEEGVTEALAAELIKSWRYYYDKNEKYDEEALITRRTAADMFVKGLGYEKLIGLNMFKLPYLDTPDNYSSIAILKGLGIIASDTAFFRPEDIITRAEFMQMIYNAIAAE